jgi:DNA-binding NarL/FixJ family response regulator
VLSRPDVVVVDDHLLIAETLQAALAAQGVSATAVAPEQLGTLLATLLDRRPRLVLLDLDLGSFGSSLGLIRPLVSDGVVVLLMTGVSDRLRIAEALEHGAIGYQRKGDGFSALLDRACAALAAGPAVPALDPAERSALLGELAAARAAHRRVMRPFDQLTERESETLQALCLGNSVHDIATDWVVAEATVRTHVRGILTKLHAPSQLAAVVAATTSGWLARKRSSSPADVAARVA